MSPTAEALADARDTARTYELNALAARDRGEEGATVVCVAVAMALYEVARVLDDEMDEAA